MTLSKSHLFLLPFSTKTQYKLLANENSTFLTTLCVKAVFEYQIHICHCKYNKVVAKFVLLWSQLVLSHSFMYNK